jgi:hypothetical protein
MILFKYLIKLRLSKSKKVLFYKQRIFFNVGVEVFTAVTMKNSLFRNIRTPFILQRKHITSPLESPVGLFCVRFEVFTAVTCRMSPSYSLMVYTLTAPVMKKCILCDEENIVPKRQPTFRRNILPAF